MGKSIKWSHQAENELNQAFLDLLEQTESISITKRVITEIFESTFILASNPEIYELDSLKINNAGNIRAYEKHTYRISYLIDESDIYILRVRYARKEPLKY